MASPDWVLIGDTVSQDPSLGYVYNAARITFIYVSCITAVYIYDWLSELPRERRLIWKTPSSVVKYLFLFTRYWSLASIVLVLALFVAPWSKETCSRLPPLKPSITILSTLGVEVILALRVASIWGNNRGIVGVVCALVCSVVVAQSIFASRAVAMQLPPGILACVSSFAPDDMVGKGSQLAFYLVPMSVDAVFLGLMFWRAIVLRRTCMPTPPIVRVLLQEQLQMFAVVVVVAGLNVGFLAQEFDIIYQDFHCTLFVAAPPMFACRMVVNLREQALSGVTSRLSSGATDLAYGIASPSDRSGRRKSSTLASSHRIDFAPASKVVKTVETHSEVDRFSYAEHADAEKQRRGSESTSETV